MHCAITYLVEGLYQGRKLYNSKLQTQVSNTTDIISYNQLKNHGTEADSHQSQVQGAPVVDFEVESE